MDANKILLETYLIFGILLTHIITLITGILIGEKYKEEKEYEENVKQIQSKKESSIYGTKFTLME